MKAWKRRYLRWLAPLILTMMLLVPATGASADFRSSQSETKSATYLWCGGGSGGGCTTFWYTMDGFLSADYSTYYEPSNSTYYEPSNSTYWVALNMVDQSFIMYNAAYSPCQVQLGIYVDVYEWNQYYYGRLYHGSPGSYAYSSSDVLTGGKDYPGWGMWQPGLNANTTASSVSCSGGDGFQWTMQLP